MSLVAALAQALGAVDLWAVFMVFLRVGAAMALVPAFGEQAVPQRIRLALALVFTAIVAPAVVGGMGPGDRSLAAAGIEVLAGLALGAGLRLFIVTLQVAGAIAAQTTSLSQIFGSAGVDPMPAIGHLLVIAGLALAVTMDLHVKLAMVLIQSYAVLPAGQPIGSADLAAWGTGEVARSFRLAFALAAPFVIASTLYNVTLGVINRAMPQLMVSFVGAPAITAGGMILLALAAPIMLAAWARHFDAFLALPFGGAP